MLLKEHLTPVLLQIAFDQYVWKFPSQFQNTRSSWHLSWDECHCRCHILTIRYMSIPEPTVLQQKCHVITSLWELDSYFNIQQWDLTSTVARERLYYELRVENPTCTLDVIDIMADDICQVRAARNDVEGAARWWPGTVISLHPFTNLYKSL